MHIFNKIGQNDQEALRFVNELYSKNTEDMFTIPPEYIREQNGRCKEFIEFAQQRDKGRRVLDIGCGLGRSAAILTSGNNASYVGIDFSAEVLRHTREFAPKHTFHQMDVTQLRFPKDTFDTFYCDACIPNIPPKLLPKTLSLIRDVTTEGGIGWFSITEDSPFMIWTLAMMNFRNYCVLWTAHEFTSLLISAHFKILHLRKFTDCIVFIVEATKPTTH